MAARDTTWDGFRSRVDEAVLLIFAMVRESLARATVALLDGDEARARAVMADDREVDERCGAVTGMIQERLAEAGGPAELEELVGILQMVPELERSADLAAHIARHAIDGLGASITPRARGLIQSMNDAAV